MSQIKFIGGSDTASLLGLVYERTPLALSMKKIGLKDGAPDNECMKKSENMKEFVLSKFVKYLPEYEPQRLLSKKRYYMEGHPYLSAEVDGEIISPNGKMTNAEAKLVLERNLNIIAGICALAGTCTSTISQKGTLQQIGICVLAGTND